MVRFLDLAHDIGAWYPHPVAVVTTDRIRSTLPVGPDGTPVERVGFHVVILPTRGSGRHMVDFEEFILDESCVLHIGPRQVQRWLLDDRFDADVLLVRPEAVPSVLASALRATTLVTLGSRRALVHNLLHDIAEEIRAGHPNLRVLIATAHLVLEHLAAGHERMTPREQMTYRAELMRAFLDEVERSHHRSRSVRWYAEQIGASTKTLVRTTTEFTGLSPKQIIDERVALEAKRLLAG